MNKFLTILAIVVLTACGDQTAPRTSNYRCEKFVASADSAFGVQHVLNYSETYYAPYPYEYYVTEFELQWNDVVLNSEVVTVYGVYTYKTNTGKCLSAILVTQP